MSKPIYEKNTRLGYKLEAERLKEEIKKIKKVIEEARDYADKSAYNCDGSYILEILDKVDE